MIKNALDDAIETVIKIYGCTAEEAKAILVRLDSAGACGAQAGKKLREVIAKLKGNKC